MWGGCWLCTAPPVPALLCRAGAAMHGPGDTQPPPGFGLRRRERAEGAGLLLSAAELQQEGRGGSARSGRARAQLAAAHPDIHLQKVRPAAAPFIFFFPFLLKRKGKKNNTKRGDKSISRTHSPAGLPSRAAHPSQPLPSAPRGRSIPAGAAPSPPRRPSPRPRACPRLLEGAIPPGEALPVPASPCSQPAGPCCQRRKAPSGPPEVSCRGQRLLAFRRQSGGILTEGFKSIASLNILPVSTSAVAKHFFFLSLLLETIDKII